LTSRENAAEKSAKDAPSARGAICLMQGANLFETLMLNLAKYDPVECPRDVPCWERETFQKKDEHSPDGRVDLFTWQSRRCRLFFSEASDGSVQVDRVKLVPGLHVPSNWEPFRDESLLCFFYHRQAKPGKPGWSQYRITTDGAVWRNSGAILHSLEEKTKNWQRTVVSEWIAQLGLDGNLADDFTCSLEVLGFATQGDQKVLMWRREHLPISAGLLRDQWSRELLRSALRQAEDTALELSKATKRLATEILSPIDYRKADPARVKQLASSLGSEMQYWSSLSTPFYEFLESLGRSQGTADEDGQDSAINSAFDIWKRRVRGAARNAFTQASSGVTQNVRGLRAEAIAEAELTHSLKDVARKLLGGGDAQEKKK
jgi:CRISPR system Cascade subunit CasA